MSSPTNPKDRATLRVPVMTMEEVPIVSEAEREELMASLREGQARIATGECAQLDPNTLVDRLMAVRAAALRKKSK